MAKGFFLFGLANLFQAKTAAKGDETPINRFKQIEARNKAALPDDAGNDNKEAIVGLVEIEVAVVTVQVDAQVDAEPQTIEELQQRTREKMRARQTVRENALRWSNNPDAHLTQEIRNIDQLAGVSKGFEIDPMANMLLDQ
jgi:hypothetical protein